MTGEEALPFCQCLGYLDDKKGLLGYNPVIPARDAGISKKNQCLGYLNDIKVARFTFKFYFILL
ncbi:hypothetical protein GOM44_00775 [Wolbachia endosymbiont of Atemnus politus]|uniref:hypothetical protein n=1 Tax=Wolbachia endosymbiont of Atemnus politus TaxID=2682840 RepID=UPI0015729360|nr:hypothetical protein [Wolbachia endosymbiont of Atemnus politus]NSX83058.1 hypothetical protein [Wolbachia endosymbiont of Atemnus politus]